MSETEKVVNLGSLVGKLTTGTGSLATFKEDKRNKITPSKYDDTSTVILISKQLIHWHSQKGHYTRFY